MIIELPEIADAEDSVRTFRPIPQVWQNSTLRDVDTVEGVISDPITLNKYLYADADPTNETDPSGHDGIWDYVNSVVNAAEDQSFADASLATAIGDNASNSIIGALVSFATLDFLASTQPATGAANQLTALVGLGNTFAQNDKSWSWNYQCAEQAAALESSLLGSQYWTTANPHYWSMQVIEGSKFLGMYHHNVVLLSPVHGNPMPPQILDSFHGPERPFSGRQCTTEPLSVWQQTYNYPE
jgi:hypothetical protein